MAEIQARVVVTRITDGEEETLSDRSETATAPLSGPKLGDLLSTLSTMALQDYETLS